MLNRQVTRRQVVPDAKVPLGALEDVLNGLRSQALLGHACNTPRYPETINVWLVTLFCAVLSLSVTINNDIEASYLFVFDKPNLDVGIRIVLINDTVDRRRAVLIIKRRDSYFFATALLLV